MPPFGPKEALQHATPELQQLDHMHSRSHPLRTNLSLLHNLGAKQTTAFPSSRHTHRPVYRACYVRLVLQCSVRLRQSAQQTGLHSTPKSMTGEYYQLASRRYKFNDYVYNHPVYTKQTWRNKYSPDTFCT